MVKKKTEGMRIIRLRISDFLGISHFDADKFGALNRITGANGTGKSSVLKAIRAAIESTGISPELINVKSEKADILVELSGGIEIQRHLTPTANRVDVKVNGQQQSSPQTFLDDLFEGHSFDPTKFLRAKPKERREILLSAIPFTLDPAKLIKLTGDRLPLDLSEFDFTRHGLVVLAEIRRAVYEQRRDLNVQAINLRKAITVDRSDLPATFDDKQFRNFDLSTTVDKLTEAKTAIAGHARDREQLSEMRHRNERLKEEIVELERRLEEAKRMQEGLKVDGQDLKTKVEAFVAPNTDPLEAAIGNYKEHQKFANRFEDIERREKEATEIEGQHSQADELYKKLTSDVPKQMMDEVELPIENLEINGDKITVKGVPIDTMSTSEQVRMVIPIARSLSGELKLILADHFESLDTKTRKAFVKETLGDGFQYVICEVADGGLNMETIEPEVEPVTAGEGF